MACITFMRHMTFMKWEKMRIRIETAVEPGDPEKRLSRTKQHGEP